MNMSWKPQAKNASVIWMKPRWPRLAQRVAELEAGLRAVPAEAARLADQQARGAAIEPAITAKPSTAACQPKP